MLDKLILILLDIFALLFGVFTVTNIAVEFGKVIMGLCALALGIVCLIRALR